MSTEAKKKTEPEIACVAVLVDEGWIVGLATENEAGYRAMNYGPYETEERAKMVASNMNKGLGLSDFRALLIAASSMWPWPAAKHAKRRAKWDAEEAKKAAEGS